MISHLYSFSYCLKDYYLYTNDCRTLQLLFDGIILHFIVNVISYPITYCIEQNNVSSESHRSLREGSETSPRILRDVSEMWSVYLYTALIPLHFPLLILLFHLMAQLF